MAKSDAPTPQTVVIAGDIVIDHHFYEGKRMAPTPGGGRGVWEVREYGGACLLERLLKEIRQEAINTVLAENTAADEKYQRALANHEEATSPKLKVAIEESTQFHLGVTPPACDGPMCAHHAYAYWTAYDDTDKPKDAYWRAKIEMGYGDDGVLAVNEPAISPQPLAGAQTADILVLDDAGFQFRNALVQKCWGFTTKKAPAWIVLKMAAPVVQGDLWAALEQKYLDRLICVVSASDLRHECVSLSRGLSWERSISDLKAELSANPALKALNNCRHLVVRFSTDGALWLDQSDKNNIRATFIGDMASAEGEFGSARKGSVFGYSSCLVAAITHGLSRHLAATPRGKSADEFDLAPAVAAGICAMRDLEQWGHGLVSSVHPTGYPVVRLAGVILNPTGPISQVQLPWAGIDPVSVNWMIVETSQRPLVSSVPPSLLGLARQVVLQGNDALKALPHAQFGKLLTADRREIEALRQIRQLMLTYRDGGPAKKPLSVGVFGPPGAGKSFGVQQLANGVFGELAWLEFNLSQFNDTTDLIGAFHQVRDKVLAGITPVVFWDEFDSQQYKWLQYLLAPMQDGRFQEGQLNHAIGKCVFVFAGGTSWSYEKFGPRQVDGLDAIRDFRLSKGPDFKSRLDAFYDVLGPNPQEVLTEDSEVPERDFSDIGWPLRRGILIRAKLDCPRDAVLDCDPDLLDALLRIPKYIHGARSLEKLVTSLHPTDGRTVRRSALPALAQLGMHVDAGKFAEILGRNVGFRMAQIIEALAAVIHNTWRGSAANKQPHLDKEYMYLDPVDKEPNRAAARRIPAVLALAGMGLEADPHASGHAPDTNEQLKLHLERLAEAEHNGWMAQRQENGWSFAKERNNKLKQHPAMVPFRELSEDYRELDRISVRNYPNIIQLAKYRIVFLGEA